ncbi:polymer biosynthesis protein, WecB/TagA/CpsF family [Salinihabitans flavidus]|uniref:Polymer biosynthesis protein, WecB/TagA/CpsF family n=1 Tax=Salinihabitans flavidus TaxID=569882 RepID=A0A1H8NZN8_9RHOB|nr:WecB/TagA/CpsF family glycosyltransferase [Salinihabitans flavidus]SEO35099.1 polymer biosynthesis protein, WecB/TagA/CpsF family [Salinihabitans flavidus]
MQFTIGTADVTVNIPDKAALVRAVVERLRDNRGFALATLNLDHLTKLNSPEFARAYAAQDFVVADGNPIVWLSRLAGRPVSLLPGSDLVVPLAQIAAREGVSVALLGSTPEALDHAAAALRAMVPDLRVALQQAPPFGFDPEGEEALEALGSVAVSGAGLCFIALGAPKQELLAARGRREVPHVGFASIGAGLDFLAGTQKRAPRWVRRLAMEWLWRMLGDPSRLVARYARCAAILPGLTLRALRLRSQ